MKKIFILIMVVILIMAPVRNCYAAAEAATLTVVGGSVAAGGIGAALATVAPVVLVVAAVALAAQGVYIVLSEESEQSGKTKLEYLQEELSIYCDAAGRTVDEFCNTVASGITVLADGYISMTDTAAQYLEKWFNSLVAEDAIREPSVLTKHFVLDGVELPVVSRLETIDIVRNNYSKTLIQIENLFEDFAVCYGKLNSSTPETQAYIINASGEFWYSRFFNGIYQDDIHVSAPGTGVIQIGDYYLCRVYSDVYYHSQDFFVPKINNITDALNAMDGSFNVVGGEENLVDGLVSDSGTLDTSVFVPAQGKDIVINPGLPLDDIKEGYGKSGTITIENYLQSLQRSLNGVQDNTIAISDALTGVIDNVGVGVYNPVGDATVTQEDEERLYAGIYTPAIDTSLNPSGSAAENALRGMQFDLTGIFPFCIPFDLFALIEKFDVEPVTPNVHLVIPLGGISEDLVFDLDFSPFEAVAQVLRTMELIAFVVGLAMVTRNIIRG